MFMNFGKEFTSEQLSKKMGNITRPIVGWSVTIRSWRHVNIAWKRKLCKGLADVAEQTLGSTVHALQSGHSLANENRIYGLSPDALLGAPEDVLQLYLDASKEWQVVNGVVPGGLGLPYQASTMDHFDTLCSQGVIKSKQHKEPVHAVQPDIINLHETMAKMQDTLLSAVMNLSAQVHQLQEDVKSKSLAQNCMTWTLIL